MKQAGNQSFIKSGLALRQHVLNSHAGETEMEVVVRVLDISDLVQPHK